MNRLKTTLLLSPLTVLMVLTGSAVGGRTGMVSASLALAMNIFSYWFSHRVLSGPLLCVDSTRRRR